MQLEVLEGDGGELVFLELGEEGEGVGGLVQGGGGKGEGLEGGGEGDVGEVGGDLGGGVGGSGGHLDVWSGLKGKREDILLNGDSCLPGCPH